MPSPAIAIAFQSDLKMARLSMNDSLTELGEDILYKASGKYQRRHTDRDSNQRGRSRLLEYVEKEIKLYYIG